MEEETPLKGLEAPPPAETPSDAAIGAGACACAGDDADASSESVDEASEELRIAAEDAAIAANPFDVLIENMTKLRKLANIEKLRLARESMHADFPLSPTMLQDWMKDEASLSARKAVELYNARAVYENQLLSCDKLDDDRLARYMGYIKYEESNGDPAHVQILYDRAVSEFPFSSDLWLGYTSYLDRTLKVPSVLKCVYSRPP